MRASTIIFSILSVLSSGIFCARELPVDRTQANLIDHDSRAFWSSITRQFFRSYNAHNSNLLDEFRNVTARTTISSGCSRVMEHMIRSPLDEEWSARLIDSMNFRPAGILSGTTTELGDFDQCIATSGMFDGSQFVGKYCFATVNIPRDRLFQRNFNFSYLEPKWIGEVVEKWHYNDNYYALATALCFPSVCRQEEIRSLLLEYYPILKSLDFNVQYCQSTEEPSLPDSRVWTFVYILAVPTVLVVLGTIAELLQKPKKGKNDNDDDVELNLLTSFSLIHNTKVLVKVTHDHADANEGHFQYIHGIRAIASFYITFCHAFGLMIVPLYMKISVYSRYPYDMQAVTKSLATQPIFNGGGLIVATFFTMSGMLLTYNALSGTKLKIKFLPYIALRWLRYTPPLIGAICMTLAMQLIGHGPLFHADLLWPTFRRCYDSWWQNLLYINNFRDFDDHCLLQTWYLAAEMQLHIIAFVLLIAYLKSPAMAYLISLSLAGIGALAIILIIGFGFSSMPLFHIFPFTQYPVQNNAARLLYFLPYMQFVAYFFGAIVGQALLEKRQLNIPPILKKVIWLVTIFIFVFFPLSTHEMVQNDVYSIEHPSWWDGIHYVIYLTLWCAANSWFFYQCSIHPESSVSRFLSAKIFQPFSRLSFSTYLVHVMTIWYSAHQTRTTISFANMNELYKNISLTIIHSLFLAYVLYLTFEAPFVNWMKVAFKKEHRESKQKQKNGSAKQNGSEQTNGQSEQSVTSGQQNGKSSDAQDSKKEQ